MSTPQHWRSLQELAASEDFRRHLEAEFPTGIEPPSHGLSRRRFLQIMAASAAMAGLTGCRWPEEKIVPFAKQPAGTAPGETRLYATAHGAGRRGRARAGHQLRRPADQDRRQPRPPRQPRRRLGPRPGQRPGSVRRGPQPRRRAARRRPRDRRHLGRLRQGRRGRGPGHRHPRRAEPLAEPSPPAGRTAASQPADALVRARPHRRPRRPRRRRARVRSSLPGRALARAREGDRRLRRESAARPPARPAQRADVRRAAVVPRSGT